MGTVSIDHCCSKRLLLRNKGQITAETVQLNDLYAFNVYEKMVFVFELFIITDETTLINKLTSTTQVFVITNYLSSRETSHVQSSLGHLKTCFETRNKTDATAMTKRLVAFPYVTLSTIVTK